MNIIGKVREILASFPEISRVTGGVHIDFTSPEPANYGLSSVGDTLISEDVLGNQRRQHSFLFYAVFSGINDYERLANSGVLLKLSQWLGTMTGGRITQNIGGRELSGEITSLTAENGMLYAVPQENFADGVQYQMQIIAEYFLEV